MGSLSTHENYQLPLFPCLRFVDGLQVPKLIEITLHDIAIALDNGIFTSEQLVQAYRHRISEVDTTFKSVLEINENALEIARELDEERRRSKRRGYYSPVSKFPACVSV